MPVEFSVAAYRLGHSMIRPGYRLNDADNMLLQIFPDPNNPDNNALTGFRAMGPGRAIDWGRFIDIDTRPYGVEDDDTNADNKKRLQFAYRIDTSLVDPLRKLPPEVASNPSSLALRNLERSWRLGLPSGQAVAKAMHLTPLTDEQIIIGKAVDEPGRRRSANSDRHRSRTACSPAIARSGPTSSPRRGSSRPRSRSRPPARRRPASTRRSSARSAVASSPRSSSA